MRPFRTVTIIPDLGGGGTDFRSTRSLRVIWVFAVASRGAGDAAAADVIAELGLLSATGGGAASWTGAVSVVRVACSISSVLFFLPNNQLNISRLVIAVPSKSNCVGQTLCQRPSV